MAIHREEFGAGTAAVFADAPVQLAAMAGLPAPKVVAVGAWPPDLFPGRQAAGRAFRVVAETIASTIDARLVVFDRSAHNPQIEEAAAFNELLLSTWAAAQSHRLV